MKNKMLKGTMTLAASALMVQSVPITAQELIINDNPEDVSSSVETPSQKQPSKILTDAAAQMAAIKKTDPDLEAEALLTADKNVEAYENKLSLAELDAAATQEEFVKSSAALAAAQQAYDDASADAADQQAALENEKAALLANAMEQQSKLEIAANEASSQLAQKKEAIAQAQEKAEQAQADYEQAQAALEQAQTDLDEFNSHNTVPEESDLSALEAAVNQAQTEAAKAQEDYNTASQIYQDALAQSETLYDKAEELKAEADSLNAQVVQIQMNLSQAQAAANEAQAAYEAALAASQPDQEEIAAAQELVNSASAALEQAQQNYDQASAAAANAQAAAIQAETDHQTAIAQAQEAQTKAEQSQAEAAVKEAALQEAQSLASAVQSQITDNEKEIENINAQRTQYEQQLADAKADVQAKKELMDKAQEDLANVWGDLSKYEQAVNEAKEALEKGSLGFYENLAADESLSYDVRESARKAVEVINNTQDKGNAYTELGALNDCTNLENMLKALDEIDVCNKLRAQEQVDPRNGRELKPLLVTSYLMAIAQKNTNWAKTHIEHPKSYNVGENLAWGGTDHFNRWFDNEKQNYIENNEGQTGHYLNIAKADYYATGFALSLNGGSYKTTYGQTFQFEHSDFAQGAMSVDEYRNLLSAYNTTLKDNKAKAEQELEAEKKNVEDRTAAAQKAYEQAQITYQQALNQLQDLESQKIPSTDKAMAELETLKAALIEAQNAVKNANNEYQEVLTQADKLTEEAEGLAKTAAQKGEDAAAKKTMADELKEKETEASSMLSQKNQEHQDALAALEKAQLGRDDLDVAGLKAIAKSKAQAANELAVQTAKLEESAAKANDDYTQAAKQAEDKKAEADDLETQTSYAKNILDDAIKAKDDAKSNRDAANELVQTSTDLNNSVQDAKDEVTALEAANAEAWAEHVKTLEGLDELQDANDNAAFELEDINDIVDLIHTIGDPNAVMLMRMNLRNDALDLKERYAAFLAEYTEKLDILNTALTAANEDYAVKQSALEQAQSILSGVETEYKAYLNSLIQDLKPVEPDTPEDSKDPNEKDEAESGKDVGNGTDKNNSANQTPADKDNSKPSTGTQNNGSQGQTTQKDGVFSAKVPTETKAVASAVNTAVHTAALEALTSVITSLGAAGILMETKRRKNR